MVTGPGEDNKREGEDDKERELYKISMEYLWEKVVVMRNENGNKRDSILGGIS